ncbi:MAG: ATP-binding protein [Bradymonadales bacterium]|nr:MAG: ATP-binding protein [Bradymonadales bacterium]
MRQIPKEKIHQKIKALNSHWEKGTIDSETKALRKRPYFSLFFPLTTQFEVNRALILLGPRRVGKTVLLHQVIQEFIDSDKDPKELIYLPLDEPLFYSHSLEDHLTLYQEAIGASDLKNRVIIFDEIQYMKDWDVQLKILVDRFKGTKFIASGSAAGALRRRSKESGAGRFSDFLLPPLTFYEYLDLLNLINDLFESAEGQPNRIKDILKLNDEFINYLNYGGFPEAIFSPSVRQNPDRFLKQDIIDKVLLRDLPSLYGIEDIQELNRLFHYLTYQTGGEISLKEISKNSGVANNTIKRYREYLEAAFLIRPVHRVDGSGKTFKRMNFFKVYLTNPSMYAALYGLISRDDSQLLGSLVETAIFSQWMHNPEWLDSLYYGRFRNGELDLLHLNKDFSIPWALEVKWSDRYKDNINELKKHLDFCRQNETSHLIVTSKTNSLETKIDKSLRLSIIPAAQICFFIGYNLIHGRGLEPAKHVAS